MLKFIPTWIHQKEFIALNQKHYGQDIMLEGQMNPYIHEAEKIADTVALHAIKTGGAIQHQHFEFMFVCCLAFRTFP